MAAVKFYVLCPDHVCGHGEDFFLEETVQKFDGGQTRGRFGQQRIEIDIFVFNVDKNP